jgi:uncharacterized membrane protein YgcG
VLAGLDAIRRALGHPVTAETALAPGTGLSSAPDSGSEPAHSGGYVWWLVVGGIVGLIGLGVYAQVRSARSAARWRDVPPSSRPWWARRAWWSGSATGSALVGESWHRAGSTGVGSTGPSAGPSDFGGGSSSGGGASGSW